MTVLVHALLVSKLHYGDGSFKKCKMNTKKSQKSDIFPFQNLWRIYMVPDHQWYRIYIRHLYIMLWYFLLQNPPQCLPSRRSEFFIAMKLILCHPFLEKWNFKFWYLAVQLGAYNKKKSSFLKIKVSRISLQRMFNVQVSVLSTTWLACQGILMRQKIASHWSQTD